MRTFTPLVATALCLWLCNVSNAGDKKKHILVRAGTAAQQVNNHPWAYTTPGQANTNCSGTGTVNGTATDTGYGTSNVSGTVNTDTNCNTTYTPPNTVSGNRVTVDNAAWVTDIATSDQYLIQCTANWVGSKCSYLTGGTYKAELEGNNMWITGMKGMKETKAKYHVLRFIQGSGASTVPSTTAVSSSGSSRSQSSWAAEETYTWETYKSLAPEDKDFVRVYCGANPKGAALVPRAKVTAGQGADHALDCTAWISAKSKAD
jgi:hypothetical protein